MNILFNTILFIIGIVLGGYWSIKSVQLPKSLDMKKTYYNSNSNEEIFSKLSYILIGGVSSLIFANTLKVNIHEIDVTNSIIYVFAMMYISTLILIAGIDRIYTKIEKRVIAFGVVSSIVYMIYLFAIDLASIHLSAIYLGIYMVLLVLDSFLLRKYAKDSYIVNILMLLNIILVYTDLRTLIYTVVMTTIGIGLYAILMKSQKKKNGNKQLKIKEIPIGFFIAASNVIVLFIIRVCENYLI